MRTGHAHALRLYCRKAFSLSRVATPTTGPQDFPYAKLARSLYIIQCTSALSLYRIIPINCESMCVCVCKHPLAVKLFCIAPHHTHTQCEVQQITNKQRAPALRRITKKYRQLLAGKFVRNVRSLHTLRAFFCIELNMV